MFSVSLCLFFFLSHFLQTSVWINIKIESRLFSVICVNSASKCRSPGSTGCSTPKGISEQLIQLLRPLLSVTHSHADVGVKQMCNINDCGHKFPRLKITPSVPSEEPHMEGWLSSFICITNVNKQTTNSPESLNRTLNLLLEDNFKWSFSALKL